MTQAGAVPMRLNGASQDGAVAKATWCALHQPWGVWFAYVRPHGPAERTRGDYRQHDEDEDEGCGQDSEDRGGVARTSSVGQQGGAVREEEKARVRDEGIPPVRRRGLEDHARAPLPRARDLVTVEHRDGAGGGGVADSGTGARAELAVAGGVGWGRGEQGGAVVRRGAADRRASDGGDDVGPTRHLVHGGVVVCSSFFESPF